MFVVHVFDKPHLVALLEKKRETWTPGGTIRGRRWGVGVMVLLHPNLLVAFAICIRCECRSFQFCDEFVGRFELNDV